MLATVISVTYEIDITGQPRKMGLDADRGGVMDGVHILQEEKQPSGTIRYRTKNPSHGEASGGGHNLPEVENYSR